MKSKPKKSKKSKASKRPAVSSSRLVRPRSSNVRYVWSVNWRDAKGDTMGMSCSDPKGLLEEALRFNAVSITLHRERKCGPTVPLEAVRGIFKRSNHRI